MKVSKYNFLYSNVFINDEKSIVYNSRTGALAVLDKVKVNQLRDLEVGIQIKESEFEKNLYNSGYIVDDNINEINYIKQNLYSQRFDKSYMMLTIAPTMSCNFACIYCFEKNSQHNDIMVDSTIDDIVSFVQHRSKELQKLEILWFGGEPLIAIQQIKRLSQKLIELCCIEGIEYSSTMSTNGYLLNEKIIEILIECKVLCLGISIDGNKEVHDSRRMLKDGNGTYNRIIENIISASKKIYIDIKITIDKENYNTIQTMLDVLKLQGVFDSKKVSVSLHQVQDINDVYQHDKCLSDINFSKFRLEFMLKNDIHLGNIYPKPKGCFCQADQLNSWVIDSLGNLYKCISDIGIVDKKVSALKDKKINYSNLHSYTIYDPTDEKKCKDCQYLPLCVGGCPYARLNSNQCCSYWKYNLDEYIKEYAHILLDNATQK